MRKSLLHVVRHWPVSDEKISFEYKLKRFVEGSLMSPERAHVFWNGTFADDEKSKLFTFATDGSLKQLLNTMGPDAGLHRYMLFDLRYYLPDDILCKVDRM